LKRPSFSITDLEFTGFSGYYCPIMTKKHTLYIASLALFCTASHTQAALPTSLSGLEVVNGKTIEKNIDQAKLGTVVVFLSAKCPCSASHEASLKSLFSEFSGKGIEFIGVHSNRDENTDSTLTHFAHSALPFPVIQDHENQIANKLNALKTPHVFILKKDGEIFYQGGVDNSQISSEARKLYLKDALTALSEGKEPPIKETRTLGCMIQR